VESIARIILLALAAVMVLRVADGTWRQWLRAKFVGDPKAKAT
jgi:hypothetical protein